MSILSLKEGLLSNLKGDIFGGITAGVIALPLALAFGVASGAGAAAGLYGAIIVGMLASLFGGTNSQISGPTGPMTVVMASLVAAYPGDFNIVFITVFLAGLFQILFGFLKFGNSIKYVPYPVISGFMSGIGFIIIILQLNPILGLPAQGNTIKSLIELFKSFNSISLAPLFVGVLTLLIVFFTPKRISKIIPSSLIALFLVTITSVLLKLDVHTIGEIPNVFPSLKFPSVPFDDFLKIIPMALTLSVLGSVDSLLTSLVADSITKTRHNSNKELIGQGIGNAVAGLFGGIAGAGATMRTVVNVKAGGKTRLSGVIHSLFLICILLGASSLAKNVPMAVLSGILIKVGFDVIDYKLIKLIKFAPKKDLAVMLLVFLLTVFYDLIFAVGVGIVLSSILFAISMSKQFNITVNDVSKNGDECTDENCKNLFDQTIRVVDIEGVFFFGSASRVITSVDEFLDTKYLIINCKQKSKLDISAVFALEDTISRVQDKEVKVFLVVSNKKIKKQLSLLGIADLIGKENILDNKEDAFLAIEKLGVDFK